MHLPYPRHECWNYQALRIGAGTGGIEV